MITPDIDGVRILDELGRGGFSVVYRAEQAGFSRTVAAKVLSLDPTDSLLVDTFMAEARNIGELAARPDVVTVYETGLDSVGRPYLLLQYLPGGSLADRLTSDGPLPVPDVLDIAATVTGVLVAAHDQGILHCDLKPANVLFDANGRPVLADFGIARATAAADSSRSMAFLTPDHAAPELWEGKPPSVSTDLYALGSMLHQLLVGRAPFQDPTGARLPPLQVMRRVLAEPAPTIVRPDVPPPLAQLIQRMLSKDPDGRPASAAAVLEELRSIGAEFDPGSARPGSEVNTAPAARVFHHRAPADPDDDRTRRRVRLGEAISGTDQGTAPDLLAGAPPAQVSNPLAAASSAQSSDVVVEPIGPGEAPAGFGGEEAHPVSRTRISPAIVLGATALIVLVAIALFVLLQRDNSNGGDVSDGPTSSTSTSPSIVVEESGSTLRLSGEARPDGDVRILSGTIEGGRPWYAAVAVLDADAPSKVLGYVVVGGDSPNRIQVAGSGPGVELFVSEMVADEVTERLPAGQRLCFRATPDDPDVAPTTVCDPAS